MTPETWDFSAFDPADPKVRRRVNLDELMAWVLSFPPMLVVITGGEPLIQRAGLERLVAALHAAGRQIEIETNGTLHPSSQLVAAVTAFNVSPKLAAAGGVRASASSPLPFAHSPNRERRASSSS